MDNESATARALIILFVEDNPAHAEMVIRSFEDQEIATQIHHVTDGEAALNYLNRRADYHDPLTSPIPDIILLDLRLPKVDGFEVLQAVKTDPNLLRIPVIILTTSATAKDISRAYQYRANSYLVKPVDFRRFVQLMNDLANYWLVWNQQFPKSDE